MTATLDKLKGWFGRPLSCRDVNGFLVDYFDEALPQRTRERFEAHVAACPDCRRYFEQYGETIALVRETGEALPEPPEALVQAILVFLREQGPMTNGMNGKGQ